MAMVATAFNLYTKFEQFIRYTDKTCTYFTLFAVVGDFLTI